MLNSLGQHDLGFSGYPFTWNNRRIGPDFTEQRLDRGIVNNAWLNNYPTSTITHLPPLLSDHVPISLNNHVTWNDGAKPFKYFGPRIDHPQCRRLIEKAWSVHISGSPAF